jgi:Fe2+ or Zn2+ uptake regulation protein
MTHGHEARIRRIRESGNKLTHARTVVLEALERFEHGHPTSAEVLAAVEKIDSRVGRASVFRSLDLFTQLNIIRPTYVSGGAPQYVLMPNGHHHHIVCLSCNRTIEFDDCGLEGLASQLEERLGVRLTGHLLEFYGVCATCQTAEGANA